MNSLSELIGSTDFVEKGTKNVVFRTCDEEKDTVVFQIGTSNALRALATAQLVQVNCVFCFPFYTARYDNNATSFFYHATTGSPNHRTS